MHTLGKTLRLYFFQTRGRTETVKFGEGTLDEMCIAFVYVTIGS
jgi:hypothetical protein